MKLYSVKSSHCCLKKSINYLTIINYLRIRFQNIMQELHEISLVYHFGIFKHNYLIGRE